MASRIVCSPCQLPSLHPPAARFTHCNLVSPSLNLMLQLRDLVQISVCRIPEAQIITHTHTAANWSLCCCCRCLTFLELQQTSISSVQLCATKQRAAAVGLGIPEPAAPVLGQRWLLLSAAASTFQLRSSLRISELRTLHSGPTIRVRFRARARVRATFWADRVIKGRPSHQGLTAARRT